MQKMCKKTLIALIFLAVFIAGCNSTDKVWARDQLVIGITQFPATLNPNINSMLAKSYVLNMALRPVTTYDQDWNLVCLLCTALPTIENGLAEAETLPNGRTGVAATYTIHPNAHW